MQDSLDQFWAHINLDKSRIENELSDLNATLQDGSVLADQEKYIATVKKHSKLSEILSLVNQLEKLQNELDENSTLLDDEMMKELATEEISKIEVEITNIKSRLEQLAVKPLSNDDKKAIIEIRPGVGGVEASLFAEQLYRMYTRYCNENKIAIELFSMDYNSEGGINEAIFMVNEPESYATFRFESGVHRVQRVPVTESGGRIHTSSASVAVIPEFKKNDIDVKAEDLRIDVFRAGGPGGQSVNTTDSAVRITHLPTGITVSCQNGKSQHKNKEMAMSILLSKLSEIEEQKQAEKEKGERSAAIQGGDRSVKIRTYNFPQGRVTDHRIKQSWFNIDEILNGNIGEILSSTSLQIRASLRK